MRTAVHLRKELGAAIASGHPWLYDRALRSDRNAARMGELVDVSDGQRVLGTGFFDPSSPIRVRLFDVELGGEPSGGWVRAQARAAVRMRRADPALSAVDAVRWIHGENDGMPGLVLDGYGDTAVVVLDGPGAAAFWIPRLDAVLEGMADAGALPSRVWLRPRGGEARSYRGDPPPATLEAVEDQIRFAVDVVRGQKTGLFLDQRDNRRRVAELSAGATVLNLFSYNGGFSIAAALGGAAMTTSVDIAGPAIDSARQSFVLSGLDPAAHELVVADVFDFAAAAARTGRRFQVVVCDPPSFAPSEKARPKALKAYGQLAELSLSLTEPEGVLVFASCSSHVHESDLITALARASRKAHRSLRIRAIHGAATDHPVRPGFPEGRYLNAIFAWVV